MQASDLQTKKTVDFRTHETTDFVLSKVREQVSNMTSEEVQQELLVQLYAQNKELKTMKGHLLFQTIIYLLGIFGAMFLFDSLSRLS